MRIGWTIVSAKCSVEVCINEWIHEKDAPADRPLSRAVAVDRTPLFRDFHTFPEC